MPKDPRVYITVHNGMPEHPKIEGLSDAAFRLLVTTWCWCSRNLTDGFITASSWKQRGAQKYRDELTAAGLVENVEGGVLMHDYTQHQRTAEEVEDLRSKRAEAGRKGGLAKAAKRVANARGVAKQSAKQTASKPVAEKETYTTTSPTGVASAPPEPEITPTQTLVGEWIKQCTSRPPGQVVGQVSKLLKQMLDEGIAYESVRAGLAAWHFKGVHPSVLPSMVHEVMNGRVKQPDVTVTPFTPPLPPEDMPEHLFAGWNRAHHLAHQQGKPGPADWHEIQEAS